MDTIRSVAILLLLLPVLTATAWADEGIGSTYRMVVPESKYLSGPVPFSLASDGDGAFDTVEAVAWYLDGRRVALTDRPPYRVVIDLGPDVQAHRITVSVFGNGMDKRWSGEFQTFGLSVAYSDRVSLVVVPVTVLRPDGSFHTGLDRDDFKVREDGELRQLRCFSADLVPLSMILLLDGSSSMMGRQRKQEKAARKLVDVLGPGDEATVMSFNNDLVRHCQFTGDRSVLRKALDRLSAGGGTALYDALYGAARVFGQSSSKRVIILFTDGRDESGRSGGDARARLDRALSAVSRADAAVYAVGLGPDVDRDLLEEITRATGGRFFQLERMSGLAEAYGRILEELGNQYTLCFRPGQAPGANPGWRTIDVELSDPQLVVRHKTGYSPSP
jgi:VWFA-related protein